MGFAKFCVTPNEKFKGQHKSRNSCINRDSGAPPLYGVSWVILLTKFSTVSHQSSGKKAITGKQ